MQMTAGNNVQSIVLLNEVEKVFRDGGEVTVLNSGRFYPACFDLRVEILDISDFQLFDRNDDKISAKLRYYAGKIFPSSKEKEIKGLLVVEDKDRYLIPNSVISNGYKLQIADCAEIFSVISLLNRRQEDMAKGAAGKRITQGADMEDLLFVELYERSRKCLKKGGRILIRGSKVNYPRCKSRSVEFINDETLKEVTRENAIKSKIIKAVNDVVFKATTGENVIKAKIVEFLAGYINLIVFPPWEYTPRIIILEADEAVTGMGIVKTRGFYHYNVSKKIISSVLTSLY
ncbi:MAG: hypothetical protein ACM3KR_02180 [Deltaproteobacteria bacterium]